MQKIFTSAIFVAAFAVISFNSFGQCSAVTTNPNPSPAFGTSLDVSITNGFSQSSGTVGTVPVNFTTTITSPIYSYNTGQSAIFFKYHMRTDGNKQTSITGYNIKITYDGGATQTCGSGVVSLTIPNGTAGIDYYFSISGVSVPANTYFKISLTLTLGDANGTTHNALLSSFQTNAVLAPAGIVLPVGFSSLEAKTNNSSVSLKWNVGSEENVNGYEVESSTDGHKFSKIGFVDATGSRSYSFVDNKPASITYYRIKSVDIDGKYSYSTVVMVKGRSSAIILRAFPSPFINELSVQHNTANARSLITINSEDGRIVKSIIPAIGSQQTDIDLSAAKSGLYLVRYSDGSGQIETLKIMKQ